MDNSKHIHLSFVNSCHLSYSSTFIHLLLLKVIYFHDKLNFNTIPLITNATLMEELTISGRLDQAN